MEFFATAIVPASVADLQRRLTIGELPHWCASIEKALSDEKLSGEIYCVWGMFRISRAEHEQDFIDSIRQFVDDWKAGLEARW